MVKVDSRVLVLSAAVLMMLIAVIISPVNAIASNTNTSQAYLEDWHLGVNVTESDTLLDLVYNTNVVYLTHQINHLQLYYSGLEFDGHCHIQYEYCTDNDGSGCDNTIWTQEETWYGAWQRVGTTFTYNSTNDYLVVKMYTHDLIFQKVLGYISTADLVDPPVANFACDNVYSLPDADITCSDLSTNTPDYWRWSVGLNGTSEDSWYTVDDVGDLFVWQGSDLGNYTLKLQVSNSAGSDWENKTNYVRIMMFPSWTATPTPAITALPWSNITTLNASVYRAQFENTLIGNLSAPFLDLTEDIVGTVEAVILSFESVINWPFTLLNEQVSGISNIFGVTYAGLLPYTVVPLAVTGRVIEMIPWQIKAIMTLGLLFDTMLLLLKGQ